MFGEQSLHSLVEVASQTADPPHDRKWARVELGLLGGPLGPHAVDVIAAR